MNPSIRLSEYMKSNNILQKDIAELFQVTSQAVSGIFKGKSKLTTDQLILIADRFSDLDIRWLLTGVEGSKENIYKENNSLNAVQEPQPYSTCKYCLEKDKRIADLEMHRDDLRKQLNLKDESLGKNGRAV